MFPNIFHRTTSLQIRHNTTSGNTINTLIAKFTPNTEQYQPPSDAIAPLWSTFVMLSDSIEIKKMKTSSNNLERSANKVFNTLLQFSNTDVKPGHSQKTYGYGKKAQIAMERPMMGICITKRKKNA